MTEKEHKKEADKKESKKEPNIRLAFPEACIVRIMKKR